MLYRHILQFILLFICSSSLVQAETVSPPEINAGSYLLVDFQSGDELVSHNAAQKIEPASITKMMTAYVIYQDLAKGSISLTDEVLISEKAWKMKGSRMFVETGKKVELNKLLHGLIIQSGNDAAVALAEYVSGSEAAFVKRMNQVGKEIGLKNTHYANVTGWPDPEHYTTARDIVTLSKRLILDFPEHYKLYSQKEYSYNNINQRNRNLLLWKDKSVDGIKTGHTESAGYCLVASAKRSNMRLISVVLGTKSPAEREAFSQQLLEYGFRFFETHKLYEAGSVLTESRIWKGEKSTVPLGTIHDLYVTIPKDQYKSLKGYMDIDKGIDAPVKRGDVLGKIKLMSDGVLVREAPLVAMENINEGSGWNKMMDSIRKLFD